MIFYHHSIKTLELIHKHKIFELGSGKSNFNFITLIFLFSFTLFSVSCGNNNKHDIRVDNGSSSSIKQSKAECNPGQSDCQQSSAQTLSSACTAETPMNCDMAWPLENTNVVRQKFGTPHEGTKHFYEKSLCGWHNGIDLYNSDYVGKDGQKGKDIGVFAVLPGKIIRRGTADSGTGPNTLYIDHGNGLETVYGHLKSSCPNCAVGNNVSKGQWVGNMGNEGTKTTAPHLHFEIRKTGDSTNCTYIKVNENENTFDFNVWLYKDPTPYLCSGSNQEICKKLGLISSE